MDHLHPNIFKVLTRYQIIVVLLDGRKQTMIYDKTTKLRTLFEDTCCLLNLDNDNLFGFATLMDDFYAFLNLDTKVCSINFKLFTYKSQNNVFFKSYSVVNKGDKDSRRYSQGIKGVEGDLLRSTSSSKSAPIYQRTQSMLQDKDYTPIIYFMVKSYVFSNCLRDKVTKSLYFLQLLRNVLNYKLKCADEVYFQLGSLAIQAYYGDHDSIISPEGEDVCNDINLDQVSTYRSPTLARLSGIFSDSFNFNPDKVRTGHYFEPKKFFPSWIVDKYTAEYLHKEIPQLHRTLRGMGRAEAEFSYIRMASLPHSNFNMHLFPVRGQKMSPFHFNSPKSLSNRLWLGLSPAGLEIHQMKPSDNVEHLSTLKWSDIGEVTHKSSCIGIHFGCRSLKLYTNTKFQSDHLFWLTKDMHMYQRAARFSATCTEEALESAERQKYQEKYIDIYPEHIEVNGQSVIEVNNSSNTFSTTEFPILPSVLRLPFVNTPVVPTRRRPYVTKSPEKKVEMKLTKSVSDVCSTDSLNSEKHSQYIKNSRPKSKLPSSVVHKERKSTENLHILANDSPYLSHFFVDDIQPTKKDLSSKKILNSLENSDHGKSRNDSSCSSIGIPPINRLELNGSLNQNTSIGRYSPDRSSVSTQQSSDKPFGSTCVLGKSNSFNILEIAGFSTPNPLPQRHQSDSIIDYAKLSRSVPLLMGLCHEFHNTHIINRFTKSNFSKIRTDTTMGSVAMKSWNSEVLFNLNNCIDNETEDVSNSDLSNRDYYNNHSIDRSPRPCFFRDMISLSSNSDSDSVVDSVEISSTSSFEMNKIKYSRFSIVPSAQVTMI